MCRLYGLSASHPTQPACDLLDAQNALIAQSREDERGLSNPHGWGLGLVSDDGVQCFRQVQPASKSEDFRAQALKAEGTTALAHVRRATIGTPSAENTHPFRDGEALLIHNGHIAAFEAVQPKLLDALPDRAYYEEYLTMLRWWDGDEWQDRPAENRHWREAAARRASR